jgi:hypothetical protein
MKYVFIIISNSPGTKKAKSRIRALCSPADRLTNLAYTASDTFNIALIYQSVKKKNTANMDYLAYPPLPRRVRLAKASLRLLYEVTFSVRAHCGS